MRLVGATVLLLGVFAGCAPQPAREPPTRIAGPSVPNRWHDSTYLEYYDAYGPVRLIKDNERTLRFDGNGRLQNALGENGLEIRYVYRADGRPDKITSSNGGAPFRLTEYGYDAQGELRQIHYLDSASGEQFHTRHETRPVDSGHFTLEHPVERIELPLYKQFDTQGQLVWSSHSDFNHGSGHFYHIRVNDRVISSRLIGETTPTMRGLGGYGYEYDDQGRLWKIISYNDNNQNIYHTTVYGYDHNGLLLSERKAYSGSSLFNDALVENSGRDREVSYRYISFDSRGNWTQRELTLDPNGQPERVRQNRSLEYFAAQEG